MRHLAAWFQPGMLPWDWSGERVHHAMRVLAILAGSLVVAWPASALFARWVRSIGRLGDEPVVGELRRSFRRLVLLVGFYEAARGLPLAPSTEHALSGLVYVLAALVAARIGTRSARALLHGFIDRTAEGAARERARREYLPLASSVATVGVGLIAVIVVAHHFGHDVSSLVTAFGVGSLAIGLAAQQTLGNMISGFTLLIDRPFAPGDRVRLASGEEGEVMEIGLRATRIVLPHGHMLIVPNAEMANSRVVNESYPAATARCEVKLRVGWDADVERTSEMLMELAHAQPETLTRPEPRVTLSALDGKGLELVLAFEVGGPDERPAVEERIRRALVKRLVAPESGPPDESAPVTESGVARTTRSKV